MYLLPEEVDALFAVIKSPRDKAIFRLAYFRGMRASEISALQLSDFDPHRGTLRVDRLKGSNLTLQRLLPQEMHALRAWLKVRGARPGPLFPSQMGARAGKLGIFTANRLDQLIKRAIAISRISGAPKPICMF